MRLDKLRDILNLPFDGLGVIYEFLNRKHAQDEYFHYKTAQGIDTALAVDECGNLKSMRLFGNIAYFNQIGLGNTLHSIEVDYDRQRKRLSNWPFAPPTNSSQVSIVLR